MGFSETVDTILKLTDLKSGNFRDVSVGRIKNLSCTDEKSGKGGGGGSREREIGVMHMAETLCLDVFPLKG